MLDWDKWQTMLAIFRNGTFSDAARSLNLDPTTVGRRLKQLEQHFDCKLFFRQDGRLAPTAQCENLLTHIEAASEALRVAEQQSSATQDGPVVRDLRLNATPYLCINLFAPGMARLTSEQRIRVELMGTPDRLNPSRREADIVIRMSKTLPDVKAEIEQIAVLSYAVYCSVDSDPRVLPWGGLIEGYVESPEGLAITELAGVDGFQVTAYQYDALQEMTAVGVVRAMLPRFIADQDDRLRKVGEVVLECPMWMLFHPQDIDVTHLKTARNWICELAAEVY